MTKRDPIVFQRRIVLVSCGEAKAPDEQPARSLYVGNLFRASLAYAESLGADDVFVVSARYYLVALDRVLPPYDESLAGRPIWEVLAWGEYVAKQIENHCDPQRYRSPWAHGKPNPRVHARIVLLAGERYATPLRVAVARRPSWALDEPLFGLRLGERLQRLAEPAALRVAGGDNDADAAAAA